jgi:hypothetical protein
MTLLSRNIERRWRMHGIRSTPAARALAGQRSEAAWQHARDVRSFSGESARLNRRFAEDSRANRSVRQQLSGHVREAFCLDNCSTRGAFAGSFYPSFMPFHERSTYVVRQRAYTAPAENRLCCVIPRGQRFEHYPVQRGGWAAS